MTHNIVAFRSLVWTGGFRNPGWKHARPGPAHRCRTLNHGVVALLAIAPYLFIAVVALFFA